MKKEEVRKSILAAAKKLFAERGFSGCTLRAISQEASVSLANVYNYFGGKDELFETVLAPTVSEVRRGLEEARQREVDGRPLCLLPDERGGSALLAFVDSHRGELELLLFRSEGSKLHHWEDGVVESLTEIWEERLRAKGAKRPSRFLLHHLASWTVQSFAEFVMHDTSKDEMKDHFDELLRFFRAGLPTCMTREE